VTGSGNRATPASRRVFVAGHNGMAGSALVRRLQNDAGIELVLRSRAELDLTRQAEVEQFFQNQRIEYVYLAAAKVGGIKANSDFPADFIRDNLQIQTNVIDAAFRSGVSRLLFLGSSCIYPRLAEQPIKESALMTAALEPSNEAYAVAKIAGIKMCESYNRQYGTDFRSVMPTNLYGPNDNFDLKSSHVLPALLRKFHSAVIDKADHVTVWGSGKPRREFMHVDDMAAACLHLMALPVEKYRSRVEPACSHVNVGTGSDVSIGELAEMVAAITGFTGRIDFDTSMPDGTPRKLLDVGRLDSLGWRHEISLESGLRLTHEWMVRNWETIRR
jgi:GDP-L-fucose synthase